MEALVTIKVTPQAQRLLRMVAALTRKSQHQALERVLQAEVKRLLLKKYGGPIAP
jgi:hypothetical protein